MRFSAIQPFTLLDFPDTPASILFTPGCNFRCGFCHNPEFVLPSKIQRIEESFIDEATVYAFLEQRRGLLEGVVITGGEPTLHPSLKEVMQRIREMGFKIKLDTNGYRPQLLKEYIAEGLLDYVAMDVKSDLEGYAELVGGCSRPEQIKESIDLLRQSGVAHEFRTTLMREIHTLERLERMCELLQGAQRWYLQQFRPGQTLDPAYQTYHPFSTQEYQRASAIAAQHSIQAHVRS